MRMRRDRAFTLIELMVVIAIVALLISILLPALGKAKASARRTVCAAQLKDIGVGLRVYLGGNRDRLPYVSQLPSVGSFPLDKKAISINWVLREEVPEPQTFHCPNDLDGISRISLNEGVSYFRSEGTSYEFRWQLNGLTLNEASERFSGMFGGAVADNMIWLMRDYWNFHDSKSPSPGASTSPSEFESHPGARRYLYIDGHVGDYEN